MNRVFCKVLGIPYNSCATCELSEGLHTFNSSLVEQVAGFYHDFKPINPMKYHWRRFSWWWDNFKSAYFQKYWKHNLYVRHPWVRTLTTGKRRAKRLAAAQANLDQIRDTFNEVMPYSLGQGLTHELGECEQECPVCKLESEQSA